MSQETELREILREFLVESRENLSRFELALLELESDPTQAEPLSSLFRSVHSIKGSCGFFQLVKIEAVTHAGEGLLDRVRDGRLAFTPEIASAVLGMVDVVRALLDEVERTGAEGPLDPSALVARLERLMGGEGDAASSSERPAATDAYGVESLRDFASSDGKVRVDTQLLERLMNLVGELVIARNQIAQHAGAQQHQPLTGAAQRLSLVTSEIQDAVMKTRMQPMAHVWSRFPRLVRDLAHAVGKRVRIELHGRETELDKSLVEAIQDPLTHLVRNAVDHGIERPVVRAELGKPVEGRVSLRAYHEAGMVNIEITDDGAGIDLAAVRRKAVARAMLTEAQAARASERELCNLLFLPGFSTQDTVTHVSGRGVGMDVVRTNIEKIGGSIELSTELGRGTTVKIKIPLTLAIIPALIVTSAGERYAIPQASLLEVVRFDLADARHRIQRVQGSSVLRLRGKLVPLVHLAEELGEGALAAHEGSIAVVVLHANERTFGLVVDQINDTEEIVVKPLWKRLGGLSVYAGATVMGDGRVALILEPMGLAQRAGVLGQGQRSTPLDGSAEPALPPVQASEQLLLCRIGTDSRLAIPLSKVARLEDVSVDRIEWSGGREVIQYRERILPLVRVAAVLEERRKRPRGARAEDVSCPSTLQVVVFAHERRSIGLVVDAIVDIADVELAIERHGGRRGVLGSMVIAGRVTELLDVEGVIRAVSPDFFADERGAAE